MINFIRNLLASDDERYKEALEKWNEVIKGDDKWAISEACFRFSTLRREEDYRRCLQYQADRFPEDASGKYTSLAWAIYGDYKKRLFYLKKSFECDYIKWNQSERSYVLSACSYCNAMETIETQMEDEEGDKRRAELCLEYFDCCFYPSKDEDYTKVLNWSRDILKNNAGGNDIVMIRLAHAVKAIEAEMVNVKEVQRIEEDNTIEELHDKYCPKSNFTFGHELRDMQFNLEYDESDVAKELQNYMAGRPISREIAGNSTYMSLLAKLVSFKDPIIKKSDTDNIIKAIEQMVEQLEINEADIARELLNVYDNQLNPVQTVIGSQSPVFCNIYNYLKYVETREGLVGVPFYHIACDLYSDGEYFDFEEYFRILLFQDSYYSDYFEKHAVS